MRYSRVFRILAPAVILPLLFMAIQSAPALAVNKIELDPSSGEIGKHLYIEGDNFQPTQQTWCSRCITIVSEVSIYFSSDEANEGDKIGDEVTTYECLKPNVYVDKNGYFKTKVWVPHELTSGLSDEDVRSGNYWIYVTYTGSNEIEAVTSFTVIASEIGLSPAESTVGTEVEISGANFDNGEDIIVLYDDDVYTESIGQTDSHGDFDYSIIIPHSIAGDHTIAAEDESGNRAEATFTVEPEVTFSSTSGAIAAEITVSGTGFGENVDIIITFDGDDVDIVSGDDNTNDSGSFEAIFEVPDLESGAYIVEVEDDDNTVEVEFIITTNLTASPIYTQASPGHVSAQVTISGVGFAAGVPITITYTSDPVVFNTTSLSDGSFSYILTIPPSQAGPHIITATDGTTYMDVTFYIESTPPVTPQPQLPLMDDKLEDWKFEWGVITDLSPPVTYDLQIATDASFTDILLEKTGLATSEYTLTGEEELESTSAEEPYYWRVRAKDAASNTSNWSGAGTFYVSSSFFELKGWKLYTLIGIGVVVIFILGFWIGRRTILEYY